MTDHEWAPPKPAVHVPGHGIQGTLVALEFAKRLAVSRASAEDFARMNRAGFSDREISEIMAAVEAGPHTDIRDES